MNLGDVLLAINSVPIRNERQASRLLSGTAGDLLVLVERDLRFYIEDDSDENILRNQDEAEYEDDEVLIATEEFLCINPVTKKKPLKQDFDKTSGIKKILKEAHLISDNKQTKVVEGLVEEPAKKSSKLLYLY